MKILMVSSFHHARGGDTTYARSVSAALAARGHEVVPFAMRHPENEPSPWETRFPTWVDPWGTTTPGRRLALLPGLIWSREAARELDGVLDTLKPDVAHLHHVHRHLTPSVLWPLKRRGVPVVWTVHDAELICPAGTLYTEGSPCERCRGHRYLEAVRHRCKGDALLPSIAVALEKTAHRALGVWDRVDRLVCPSRFMADALVRFGLPPKKVLHLPNFLDIDAHAPGQAQGRGWLFAGRLAPEKGLDTLLQAAEQIPDAQLTVCGAGPWEGRVRAMAARLPQVRLLGHVPRAALMALVREAAIIVVPSRWLENYPYAVLEAQAAGRAVVASRIGGIPEQIDDGVDGVLVPPGDPAALASAVRGLLADPGRARRMGEAARVRVVRERAPAGHVEALTSLYAALREGAETP